jgi:hypothetical protein
VNIENIHEPRSLCECYGQPLKVITANNQSIISQNISLNSNSTIAALEIWIKVWEGRGTLNTREIFGIDKVIRARLIGLLGM